MAENLTNLDVIIIGGGPAGLSAALWCSQFGLKAVVFEKEPEFGGQLLMTFNAIRNYLGVETADGRQLRDRFLEHFETADVRRVAGAGVESTDLARKTVGLTGAASYSARAMIIATGVRRRKLGVPGEEQFCGKGILDSGVRSRLEMSGKTVLIVGGGDAAIENPLLLSDTAAKVIVVHRRTGFTARKEFIEGAQNSDKVEFLPGSRVTAILGTGSVTAVDVQQASGKSRQVPVDAVLVRIGVEPNTGMFRGQVNLDDAGYVIIDNSCATSVQNVFAIGDVANPTASTISIAVGHGAIAAKAILQNMRERPS